MKQFGRVPILQTRLNELLGEKSITEFAKELGISRQTLGFYLNGDRIPDAETLIKICERCQVSSDWLLGLSSIKTSDIEVKAICQYTGLSETAIDYLHWEARDQETISALDYVLGIGSSYMHELNILMSKAILLFRSSRPSYRQKPLASYIPDDMQTVFFDCLEKWGGETLSPRDTAHYYASQAAYALQRILERAIPGPPYIDVEKE